MSPITAQEGTAASLREPESSNSARGPKPLIKTEYADWIGTIAFDNYAKRNALGADLIAEVIAAFDRFNAQGTRAVVLRSACDEKVWSSSHDVDELPKANIDPLPYGDPLERILRAVKSFPTGHRDGARIGLGRGL